MNTEAQVNTNYLFWNESVPLHAASDFYQLNDFKTGKLETSLLPLEIEVLGSVQNKSLLHLQCHFGMDTLSWAKKGAQVTGVDFSEDAVQTATTLAKDMGLTATFIQSDVLKLQDHLTGEFDIVFTSYGVLCWIADLKTWAKNVAKFLKKGGTFFLKADGHPVCNGVRSVHPPIFADYFAKEPSRETNEGTYASSTKMQNNITYEWNHTLSDIVMSLIQAGLTITSLQEFPYTFYCAVEGMEKHGDWWWSKGKETTIPLMFCLTATKQ